MLSLSNNEKNFLTKLVKETGKTTQVFAASLLDDKLINIGIKLDRLKNHVVFNYNKKVYPLNSIDETEKTRELQKDIIIIAKLLKYLELEGYLFLILEFDLNKNYEKHYGYDDKDSIEKDVYDPYLKELMFECFFKTIIIQDTLKEYVKNNFKTKEQLNHEMNIDLSIKNIQLSEKNIQLSENNLKQSNKGSHNSLYVALGIGTLSIIASFFILRIQLKSEIKINTIQFNDLQNQISLFRKDIASIDSLVKGVNFPDTINTKIINETANKKYSKNDEKKSAVSEKKR